MTRPQGTEPPEEEAAYDRFAEAYRDWWAPVIAPYAVRLLDRLEGLLPIDRPATVVDIGAGSGTLSLALLRRWPRAHVVGVDPSRRMLEIAKASARAAGVDERLTLEIASGARLPIPDATADAVMSSFVIQLVPRRAAVVREAFRVLRSEGVFACVTWRSHEADFAAAAAFDDVLDELDLDVPDPPPSPDRSYPSPASAAAELRRAGFRSVRAREEWLEHRFTPASYLALLENWIADEAFDAQNEPNRRRLREATLRRLEQLPADALVWRRPLISVAGIRPGQSRSRAA